MSIFDECQVADALGFFNQLPEFILWKDLDCVYRLMNEAALQYTGEKSTSSSFKGLKDNDFNCEASELAELFQKEDRLVFKTKKTITTLNFCQYANDNWRLLLGRKSPLFDKDGHTLVGLSARGIDITDCRTLRMVFSMMLPNYGPFNNSNKLEQATYIIKDAYDEYNLSPRESECLFFVIRGKTAKETARILNISHRTVETYIDSVKIKLGCRDKKELIEKSMSLGIHTFIPKSVIGNL